MPFPGRRVRGRIEDERAVHRVTRCASTRRGCGRWSAGNARRPVSSKASGRDGPGLAMLLGMNRIAVVGDKSINAQVRTYAEYRVFATLTRHGQHFRRVRVLLRERDGSGKCDNVTCAVAVALEPSASVRIRVTGSHVYAAINRAIDRLGDALGARVEPVGPPDHVLAARAHSEVRGPRRLAG